MLHILPLNSNWAYFTSCHHVLVTIFITISHLHDFHSLLEILLHSFHWRGTLKIMLDTNQNLCMSHHQYQFLIVILCYMSNVLLDQAWQQPRRSQEEKKGLVYFKSDMWVSCEHGGVWQQHLLCWVASFRLVIVASKINNNQ